MIETAKKILNGKYKFGSWRIEEFLDLSVVENAGLTPEQFLADLVELFLRNCMEPGAVPVAVVTPALSGRITTRKGVRIDHDRLDRLEVGDMLYPHPAAPRSGNAPVADCHSFVFESKAFEAWAAGKKLPLGQHPLHYLFLDSRTHLAREAWREAVAFCRGLAGARTEG